MGVSIVGHARHFRLAANVCFEALFESIERDQVRRGVLKAED